MNCAEKLLEPTIFFNLVTLFQIGHIVGMCFDWPDCFYSGWLRANWNISGKLGMKFAYMTV